MGELKRIVCQKKYLFSILILFIINVSLFQYFQKDNLKLLKDVETKGAIENQWREEQKIAKRKFIEELQNMKQKSNLLSEISIFSNKNTFSNKNIEKTLEDFKKINSVHIDTKYLDKAVSSFLEYDDIFFLLLLFIFMTVLNFFDERKSGLWQITYGCKNGRMVLAYKRLAILLFLSMIVSGILFLETLCVSFWNYGETGILFSSVQSVVMLQNFTLPISVLEFLLYYWVICACTLFVSGLFLWGILSIVHNRNLGIVMLIIVYGIEMALYYVLPEQHPLCVLRYLNFWFLVNPKQLFVSYTNFPIGIFIVNLREFVHWLLGGLIVLLSVGTCYVNMKTKPFYVKGIAERLLRWFCEWCKKSLCHCGGIVIEFYKILIQGKGILVVLIFSYLIISGISMDELLVSPAREQLIDFYAENTKEITKENLIPYERKKAELEKIYEEMNNAPDGMKKEVEDTYQSYEATRIMFGQLKQRLKYAENLKKKGIESWWMDETGYRKLLGKENASNRMIHGALAILTMILILAGNFAIESQSGVRYIIRCTSKGRRTFFLRKVFCTLVVAVFVSAVVIGAEIYEVGRLYPFRGLSAPVQNLSFLGTVPFSLTIGQFLCIWVFLRMLIYIVIANLCLLISSLTERVEKSKMFSLILLVFIPLTGVSEYMVIGTERLKKTVLVVAMAIVCFCISIVLAYRKWRNVYD